MSQVKYETRLQQVTAEHAKYFPNKKYRHVGELQMDLDTTRNRLEKLGVLIK